jgi:hypothetical protein
MAETGMEPGVDIGFVVDFAKRWEAAWNSH